MGATARTRSVAAPILAASMMIALMLSAAGARAQSGTTEPQRLEAEPESVTYWLRNREGWFWYRDPPAAARRPAPPAPKPPRELVEFEAMQKRLEDLKRAGARGLMVLPVERMLA